ncbi:MAG: hypothetical protein AAGC60_30405 [Acidobacteriota bacterium]
MSRDPLTELEQTTRAMRGALASLRAAAEALELFPAMEPGQRARLHGVVNEEAERLGGMVGQLEELVPHDAETTPVAVDELLALLRRAVVERGFDVELEPERSDPPGARRRVPVDRRRLGEAARRFAASLRRDFAVVRCDLGADAVDDHLLLDWSWRVELADQDRLQDWQGEALGASLRPAARDHDGEAWFDLDREDDGAAGRARVRLLLPLEHVRADGAT